ncbi:MAG: hypothetical protein JSU74_01350 [Candidatus Zixiibacteriota bacterium]|nr:MAG: hypothetical protein JSU74_01350 [candidate division Zixibacteria bacterium]
MNPGKFLHVIAIAVCLIALTGSTNAEGGLSAIKQKTLDFRLNLVPYVTSAVLAGEADERIGELSNDFSSKLVYAFGTTLNLHTVPSFALGLSIEYSFKNIPMEDEVTAQGWLISVGGTYYSRTHIKAIPYARLDAGLVTAKISDYFENDDLKLGTHPFMRFGFGMLTIMSSSVNTRLEIYYKIAFSSNHELDRLGDQEIGFDGKCVGLEFGIGFPLLSR